MGPVRLRAPIAVAAALALVGCGPAASDAGRARSVILISLDTVRADHLSCLGSARPTSPNIDALAAAGTLFEDATTTAPWTVPAHLSMLTGLYPRSHGVDGWTKSLPPSITVLPELLRAHGLSTAAFVNAHLLRPERGFGRGFEHFHVTPAANDDRGATRAVLAAALDWIEGRGKEPFFAFLHLYDAHSDYRARARFRERFVGGGSGVVDGTTAQLKAYREGRIEGWGAAEAEALARLYDAGLAQLDADLARLFERLKASDLWSTTLVVLTSDHGEEFLEHGSVLHGRTLHRELVDVPLVLRGPGVPAGRRVAGDVSLVDIAPTVLALVGAPAPEQLEGVDLSQAWLAPESWPPRRAVFSEADRWMAMRPGDRRRLVRKGRYALHFDELSGRHELFDLELDPDELEDISAREPTLVQALRHELERFESGARELDTDLELSAEELAELQRLGYF